jgi:hypothetical protein
MAAKAEHLTVLLLDLVAEVLAFLIHQAECQLEAAPAAEAAQGTTVVVVVVEQAATPETEEMALHLLVDLDPLHLGLMDQELEPAVEEELILVQEALEIPEEGMEALDKAILQAVVEEVQIFIVRPDQQLGEATVMVQQVQDHVGETEDFQAVAVVDHGIITLELLRRAVTVL